MGLSGVVAMMDVPTDVLLIQFRTDPWAMTNEYEILRKRIPEHISIVNALTQDLSYREPRNYLAVILGGSGDICLSDYGSVNRVIEQHVGKFLDKIIEEHTPALGLCFGMQYVGYHLQTPLAEKYTRKEVGTVDVFVVDAQKKDPLFTGIPHSFFLQSGHHDALLGVPEGAQLLALNNQCTVQIFRLNNFYGFQGHPESTLEDVRERYERAVSGGYALTHRIQESPYGPLLINNFMNFSRGVRQRQFER